MNVDKKQLSEFLWYRMSHHRRDCTFWMYLIVVVCGVGAAGVWMNVYSVIVDGDADRLNTSNLATAIYIFFSVGNGCILCRHFSFQQIIRPIRMLSVCMTIFSLVLMILCAKSSFVVSVVLGIVGCIMGVLTWIVSHGDDTAFDDTPPSTPALPMGGNVDRPVPGDRGDMKI
jgi:hypothetical protein